jgi:hypothetical protein
MHTKKNNDKILQTHNSVKKLGLISDNDLRFRAHVNLIVKNVIF